MKIFANTHPRSDAQSQGSFGSFVGRITIHPSLYRGLAPCQLDLTALWTQPAKRCELRSEKGITRAKKSIFSALRNQNRFCGFMQIHSCHTHSIFSSINRLRHLLARILRHRFPHTVPQPNQLMPVGSPAPASPLVTRGNMGGDKVIVTSEGRGKNDPSGKNSRVPLSDTGIIGAPVSTAALKAPN